MRHHFEYATHGVAGAIGLVDDLFHLLFDFRVDAAEQNFVLRAERDQFFPAQLGGAAGRFPRR